MLKNNAIVKYLDENPYLYFVICGLLSFIFFILALATSQSPIFYVTFGLCLAFGVAGVISLTFCFMLELTKVSDKMSKLLTKPLTIVAISLNLLSPIITDTLNIQSTISAILTTFIIYLTMVLIAYLVIKILNKKH